MSKYLLIKINTTNELVIIDCAFLDDEYELIKSVKKIEQLSIFKNVSAIWNGASVEGGPLFISGR